MLHPQRLAVALSCILGLPSLTLALEPVPAQHFEAHIRPLLVKYCGDCHDPDDKGNAVKFLRAKSIQDLSRKRTLWNSVAHQLRNRTMPPATEEQPSEQERMDLANWIDETLRATACERGEYAGAVTSRRLNLHEYERTIKDLTGLQFDFSETFPADGGGGEGFDNNGETLYLPAMLMEKYVETAQQILDQSIQTPLIDRTIPATDFVSEQGERTDESLRVAAAGEAATLISIYLDGPSSIQANISPASGAATTVQVLLDGVLVETAEVTTKKPVIQTELRLTRGLHRLTLKAPKDFAGFVLESLHIAEKRAAPTALHLQAHQKILGHPFGESPETREEARRVVAEFANRAFRRPVDDMEVDRFLTLYDRANERGDPFSERIKLALKGVLVSPHFLLRVEQVPEVPGIQPVSDYELASRLSYFLWGTMPDEELMQLAAAGKLQNPDVLLAQTRRMLNSERSMTSMEEFVGQWLGTNEVGLRVFPEVKEVRDRFVPVAADLRAQPVYLWKYLLDENRSLLEFVDADYVLVNDKLAAYYGLPELQSDTFVPVPDEKKQRSGLLGLGGVHAATSNGQRTSPVSRGAWVLETMLGTPVPPPPPDIPPLSVKANKGEVTVRAQLTAHRDNPACAACHNIIDPIGFALENYDLTGLWRDKAGKTRIDASAVMPDGEKINGPVQLKQVLLKKHKREFVRHFVQKLLGYALGRSLLDEDQCTIEQLTDDLDQHDYQARRLVEQIVLSIPFRNQQLIHPDGTPVAK